MRLLLLCGAIICLSLIGCASSVPRVQMLNQSFSPKSENETIEIFKNNRPNRQYIEIAEITYEKNDLNAIVSKAKELGADAVIITGAAGVEAHSTLMTVLDPEDFHSSKAQEYGLKAVAIKYKYAKE